MTVSFPTVVLCEYASRTENNKHVLAGVYAGDIIVAELPARLRLALYVEILPTVAGNLSVDFTIHLGGKEFAKILTTSADVVPGRPGVILVPNIELGADKDVEMRIDAFYDDQETTILKKQIYKGTITSPSAS